MKRANIFQSKISSAIALTMGVLVMAFFITMVARAWTEPAQPPPDDNVPAPLNVGSAEQTKTGILGIDAGGGDALRIKNGGDLRIYRVGDSGSALLYCDDSGELVTPGNLRVNSEICLGGVCYSEWPETNLNGWSFSNNYFYDDGEEVVRASDEWLRLNQAGQFTSGVYTPGLIRADGGFQVDGRTAVDSSNRYHYAYYNGEYDRFGKVNNSGFGIDADNTGDYDILIYESQIYTSNLRLGYSGSAILSTYNTNENLTIDPSGSGDTIINGEICIGGVCRSSWPSTSESDTLDSVADRGTSTNQFLTFAGFYDYNNTGYYVNPNGTSLTYRMDAASQMRAPIYYDRNDTYYYANPASTSRIRDVDIRGWAYFNDTSRNGWGTLTVKGRVLEASSYDMHFRVDSGRSFNWHKISDWDYKMRLDVNTGNLYIDGTYYCDNAADIAEKTPSVGNLSLATVVCLDEENEGHIRQCRTAYEHQTAGIVSTNPGMILGNTINDVEIDGVNLALAGRVPVKTTTENGPIEVGDLLVSSSKPGYAMKGDREKIAQTPGVVLGKAMESLHSGEGEIMVLIMLR